MSAEIEVIKSKLKNKLSRDLYSHSVRVAETAEKIAQHYSIDSDKAYLAGLLHDFAKELSYEEMIKQVEISCFNEDEEELDMPEILHGPVGAILLPEEFGIDDQEMLQAIRFHTLGHVDMTEFDKVIYLADKVEPGRDYPGLVQLYALTFIRLDEAILFSLESTIKLCLRDRKLLHSRTVKVRNKLLKQYA